MVLIALLPVGNAIASDHIDSLKQLLTSRKTDTAQIRIYLQLSKAYRSPGIKVYDSSVFYLNKATQLSEDLKYYRWMYDIYNENTELLLSSGNSALALGYYFKMLKLLDEEIRKKDTALVLKQKYAALFQALGICYFNVENSEKALSYYNKCLKLVGEIYEQDKSYPLKERQLMLYNNIGSVYLTTNDTENARINYEKAVEINKTIGSQVFYGTLYNNLGITHKTNKNYKKAFEYYDKSLEIRQELKDTAGIAQVCNNLGDCYYLTGNNSKSIEILNTALSFSRLAGNLSSQIKAANFLALSYEKSGNYKLALDMHKLYKQLYDSINNTSEIALSAKLEMQYLFEKQQKENELFQKIELANKQRKVLVFMIISGILLSFFVVLMLLYRNQKIKIKRNALQQESLILERKNLQLEKHNLQLEKNKLAQELDYRNKELATHVMYLLKKNEFISSISEKLLNIKTLLLPENKKWVQDIIREMQSNVDNTVWGEFEMRFQQVHTDFYDRLKEHFPELTPNEKKICAFLRLNMTTKDISAITFQSIKSIQVARTRLRKKMDMTRDDNLITFLQQL